MDIMVNRSGTIVGSFKDEACRFDYPWGIVMPVISCVPGPERPDPMKTSILRTLVIPLALALGLTACGEDPALPAGPRVNVLLVTLDTVRADHLGCYGAENVETPALNALAARGVRFEDAHTPVPITLPSHTTILTGLLPPEHGVRENDDRSLGKGVTTLAEAFKEQGYATGAFIGAFVLDSIFGLDQGFDTYDDHTVPTPTGERERPADRVTDAALAWLKKKKDSPFFCWVHYFDPHAPYAPPAPFDTEFEDRPYDGEIAFTDTQCKRLFDWLDASKLTGRTLVVVTADHGEGLGEHDEPRHCMFLYDTTMKVPLILSRPGSLPEGRIIEDLASTADLFPTILEAAGLEAKTGPMSRSLLGLIDRGDPDRAHYGESDYPLDYYGWSPLRSLTTSGWKYIRAPKPELYDRMTDPGETRNQAEDLPILVEQFEKKLTALEAGMTRREAERVALTDAQRRDLSGLGYAAAGTGGRGEVDYRTLKDPKEMAGVLNRWTAALDQIRLQRSAAALETLMAIVAEHPDVIHFRSSLGSILSQIGRHEAAAEHFSRALELFEKSGLKLNAGTARIYAGLAMVKVRLGAAQDAVPLYRKALLMDPSSVETHHNLGMALLRVGRTLEAVISLRNALTLDPDNKNVSQGHAKTLQALGGSPERYRQGVELMKRKLPFEPVDPAVMDVVARVLAAGPEELRDLDTALKLANRACTLTNRGNPIFLDTLAIVNAARGRFQEALSITEEAAGIARRYNDARLGSILEGRVNLYRNGKVYRLP